MTGNIVKGVTMNIASFPYFALILFEGQVHCGGAIVSTRVILTANHCIDMLPHFHKLLVALGADNINGGTRYKVCNVYGHPDYDVNGIINDVGLLLLRSKIKFEPKVQKARLIEDPHWRDKARRLAVIGYGSLETYGPQSEKLQMTVMEYVPNDVCTRSQNQLPGFVNTPSTMFCMIGERWTSDCFGDSGSPISWRGFVVGLVNVGRSFFCASDMIPSMYLDVYKYRGWISKNVKRLEQGGCMKKKNRKLKHETKTEETE